MNPLYIIGWSIFFCQLKCQSFAFDNKPIYLLYDIAMNEGFNLRRDVYVRIANLIRALRDPNEYPFSKEITTDYAPHNWILVLPPWGSLPHWKTFSNSKNDVYEHQLDDGLPWSTFFDLKSLQEFIPVIEFVDFRKQALKDSGSVQIDRAFQIIQDKKTSLRNNEPFVTLEQPSHFQSEDVSYVSCNETFTGIYQKQTGEYQGFYSDTIHMNKQIQTEMSTMNYECLFGVLQAVHLAPFLSHLVSNNASIRAIFLFSAESLIHGTWSEWTGKYWTARRSMVFAEKLRRFGDDFRAHQLESNDQTDGTVPPKSWLNSPWPLSPARGGPYIAVHWRRGDFEDITPSPSLAAKQIVSALQRASNGTDYSRLPIFISTDASDTEFSELVDHLKSRSVFRYTLTTQEQLGLTPGEIAIIDQWICAHASYFIGTSPSTFTFRITEERQIMGFLLKTTYNTLCPHGDAIIFIAGVTSGREDCDELTVWPVVYEPKYSLDPRIERGRIFYEADDL